MIQPYYQTDQTTLFRGDSLAVLQHLPDASVDAIITDPPYSSGGLYLGARAADPAQKYVVGGTKVQRPSFGGDNRDQRSYEYWCALWLSECLRVAKPGSPLLMFTDWRQIPVTSDAIQAGGWVWRGIVVWDKTEGSRPDKGRFRHQCEYVVWGSHGALPSLSAVAAEAPCLPGLFRHSVRQRDKHHLTGKPTPLMRDLLRITRPGATVLDLFMGSGTTGVACALEGRRFIGVERSEEYAEIAKQRIAEAELQGQGA